MSSVEWIATIFVQVDQVQVVQIDASLGRKVVSAAPIIFYRWSFKSDILENIALIARQTLKKTPKFLNIGLCWENPIAAGQQCGKRSHMTMSSCKKALIKMAMGMNGVIETGAMDTRRVATFHSFTESRCPHFEKYWLISETAILIIKETFVFKNQVYLWSRHCGCR